MTEKNYFIQTDHRMCYKVVFYNIFIFIFSSNDSVRSYAILNLRMSLTIVNLTNINNDLKKNAINIIEANYYLSFTFLFYMLYMSKQLKA